MKKHSEGDGDLHVTQHNLTPIHHNLSLFLRAARVLKYACACHQLLIQTAVFWSDRREVNDDVQTNEGNY